MWAAGDNLRHWSVCRCLGHRELLLHRQAAIAYRARINSGPDSHTHVHSCR